MKWCSRILLCIVLVGGAGCSLDEDPGFEIFSYNYDFTESDFSWQYGFSDFPASGNDSGFYELQFAYTTEPISSVGKKGLMLSGNNHSDDLFMYLKKRIEGLAPETQYTVTYEVEFASDAKKGTLGAGGSPGESVFLKVGATAIEPKSVIEAQHFTMNIDKGNQAEDGEDMIAIGNIAVPEDSEGFVLALRSNAPTATNTGYDKPLIVRTNSRGELWLIVGTDSGYEGITTIYYTKISAVFSKSK
jgi:hypothetical protein